MLRHGACQIIFMSISFGSMLLPWSRIHARLFNVHSLSMLRRPSWRLVVAVSSCLAAAACLAIIVAPADRISLEERTSDVVLSGGWLLQPLKGPESSMLVRRLERTSTKGARQLYQDPVKRKRLVLAACTLQMHLCQ